MFKDNDNIIKVESRHYPNWPKRFEKEPNVTF